MPFNSDTRNAGRRLEERKRADGGSRERYVVSSGGLHTGTREKNEGIAGSGLGKTRTRQRNARQLQREGKE